jgi:hypothetical protein
MAGSWERAKAVVVERGVAALLVGRSAVWERKARAG